MLLHSLKFLRLLLAVAKPIFLSSHASFTPSIYLKRGLPTPFSPLTSALHFFGQSLIPHLFNMPKPL